MNTWKRFKDHFLYIDELDISLDISRMRFSENYLNDMEPEMQAAFQAMDALEKGGIANPDENRMVGHYWLRAPKLAPTEAIAQEIESTLSAIKRFATQVHQGTIKGSAGIFKNLLVIGIGGSALGPQFASQALGCPKKDSMNVFFFDNTDPDGIDLTLAKLEGKLGETLSVVISKSGGTPETRNGMLEAEEAYKNAGLDFAKHAIAITGEGSTLDKHAKTNGWITTFPMWDWVGGRTSELAAVGLLPAALQGIDIDGMIQGAHAMDVITRNKQTRSNPAALLALMWYHATEGRGKKDMVILPYKDRLMLLSKYLQQLVMESLGKEKDIKGNVVNQGIAVYGNKGSTDQHAYVQQLREGVNNFFVTFIEVQRERSGKALDIEPDTTSGDYLEGLLLGTRDALYEKDRQSITITLPEVSAHTVGQIIALYERAVGFYGTLVGINAYNQPGVEAGKKAAASVLELKDAILSTLRGAKGEWFTAEGLANKMGSPEQTERVFKLLEHMKSNPEKGVVKQRALPFHESKYSIQG
jgi:glucose-6-phosphate isomerase